MKSVLKITATILMTASLFFLSCKKEYSCENCGTNPPLGGTNKSPIANAGLDQTIILPTDSVKLDGSASSDPDGTISSFQWTKISGPASFIIVIASTVRPTTKQLVMGVYQFELKVTDNGGLSAKDTVQVMVNAALGVACDGTIRPQVNVQLLPIGTLSQNRQFISAVSAGNKIFFAGGTLPTIWIAPYASTRVDIFDVVTQSWTTAELSEPRWQMATVAAGSKVFFAGGGYYDDGDNAIDSKNVDIYDIATNQWSVANLSSPKHDMAAATVGNKVFFAGGMEGDNLNGISKTVDIYNLTTNSWATTQLSEPKKGLTAVTVNNRIYFAGGISGWIPLPNSNFNWIVSNKIDVYDNSTNSWSTTTGNIPRYYFAGINVDDKIYWAGGIKNGDANANIYSCEVEIKDINTGNSSIQYLSVARDFYIDGSQNAIVKDNKILFFAGSRTGTIPGSRQFDIYDLTTNTWSIGILPVTISEASIISVNNTIYVAGGFVNGVLSNQVWKLEF